MTRTSKIFIGILSFLPILITACLFITMFIEFTNSWGSPGSAFESPMMLGDFGLFFFMVIGLLLLSFGMLIYFIVHVATHKKMDSTERAIWILAFVLGGAICYPIYWYMKIWREEL